MIVVRLIGLRTGFRSADEMLRALRHRYVMVYYAGLAVLLCGMVYGLSSIEARTDLVISSLVLGLVALHLVVMVYLRVAAAVLARFRKGAAIWITPALVLGTVAMKRVVELAQSIMGVPTDWSDGWRISIWVLCFVLVEAAAAVIFSGPVPRAVAALRASEERLAVDEDAGLPLQAQKLVVDETVDQMPGPLQVGSLRVPLAQVQRLEANGNYVLIVTAKKQHLVPGPFAAVASKMPELLGRRVHRSHWVAATAVQRLVKSGRDLWIEAVGDAVIPVGTSMQESVTDWLSSRAVFVEQGPKQRARKAER